MKDIPILFSAPMVRAILDGRKSQTRRVVKPQPQPNGGAGLHPVAPYCNPAGNWTWVLAATGHGSGGNIFSCPYGQPGDRLWVKETFFAWGRWETRFSAKKGRDEWHFIDMTLECGKQYRYAVDMVGENAPRGRGCVTPQWWKRPAIFMPRAASRINLDNRDVCIERLQDISKDDAMAEGIVYQPDGGFGLADSTHYNFCDPRYSYQSLWESINGEDSWDANPWVWAVEFNRVQP